MAKTKFGEDFLDFIGWGSASRQRDFEAEQAEINRQFQQNSAREAMQFEAEQAEITRNYETEMSNTAHQRQVADLQSAGLNPILSANTGASTPSVGVASGFSSSGSSAHGVQSNGDFISLLIKEYASTAREAMKLITMSGDNKN